MAMSIIWFKDALNNELYWTEQFSHSCLLFIFDGCQLFCHTFYNYGHHALQTNLQIILIQNLNLWNLAMNICIKRIQTFAYINCCFNLTSKICEAKAVFWRRRKKWEIFSKLLIKICADRVAFKSIFAFLPIWILKLSENILLFSLKNNKLI